MQPAGHAVPKASKMLRIAARNVLPAAFILRRTERLEEVVVRQPLERPIAVYRGIRNDSWLVDVVILEGIIHNSVRHLIAVVVAVRASGTSLRHLRREEPPATGYAGRLLVGRELCERIGHPAGLVLRP